MNPSLQHGSINSKKRQVAARSTDSTSSPSTSDLENDGFAVSNQLEKTEFVSSLAIVNKWMSRDYYHLCWNDCSDFSRLDNLYFFRSLSCQLLRTYAEILIISNYQ
ncbi:hypothetical protein N44_01004 [Microcystis aeruginosa NIES-44]|uniref:Uncharacterized protein n=1 Tax=Microcystis aeruginosa NIES-44 TaxID=449439 RepID=A0A0A1VT46_MICAE|nr:hypothetical protein N44_01004 [Microcystis aeruginosa NIES-44]